MDIKLNQQGQLFIEILLAITIAALVIGAFATAVVVSLKSGKISGDRSVAVALASEGLEAAQSIADNDWHKIYYPPFGKGNPNYLEKNGTAWQLTSNPLYQEDISINNIVYRRTIYIEDVKRNKGVDRQICAAPGDCLPIDELDDPSTQKVKVTVSFTGSEDIVVYEYLTRWRNRIFKQGSWTTAKPVNQTDCQNIGGAWDAATVQCYAPLSTPANESGWSTYSDLDNNSGNIDTSGGTLKLQ